MINFNWSSLSDTEFELLCKDILVNEQFENVKRVSGPGSGDFGCDIIAEENISSKLGIINKKKIMIQCKNYAGSGTTISPNIVEEYALRAESLSFDSLLIITSHDLSSGAKTIAELISTNSSRNIQIIYWTESELINKLMKYKDLQIKYFQDQIIVNKSLSGIKGRLSGDHIYINCLIKFSDSTPEPLIFLVDTGASVTTIGPADVNRLKIDYEGIQPAIVKTMSGVINVFRLPDVEIYFPLTNDSILNAKFNEIHCFQKDQPFDDAYPSGSFSLLGMDFLRNYLISPSDGILYPKELIKKEK